MGSNMVRVSLTDRFVAGAKSSAQTDYFDDLANTRGLALRAGERPGRYCSRRLGTLSARA
jgi:hypothetical protein